MSIDYSLPTTPQIANRVLLHFLLLMKPLSLIYQFIIHCLLPRSWHTHFSYFTVASEAAVSNMSINYSLPNTPQIATQYY